MKAYSWEFGSAKKHIDKSCFASNERGIPKVARAFFGVDDLAETNAYPQYVIKFFGLSNDRWPLDSSVHDAATDASIGEVDEQLCVILSND